MPETKPDRMVSEIIEGISTLDAMVRDSSDPMLMLEIGAQLAQVADVVKIAQGGVDVGLRRVINDKGGAVFLKDGRTMRIGKAKKRTITGKELIRQRITERAIAAAEGEIGEAIKFAVSITEEAYTSPSSEPKWGALKKLGFSAWSEVAEENEVDGKVEFS